MSGKVKAWVWDSGLPQNEKFVMLAYADTADHDGESVMPSNDLIVWMTGYSLASVKRIKKSLIVKGYLIPTGETSSKYLTRIGEDSLPKRPPRATQVNKRGRPIGSKNVKNEAQNKKGAQNKPGLFCLENGAQNEPLTKNMNPTTINSKELEPLQALPQNEFDTLHQVLKGNLGELFTFLREKTNSNAYTEDQLIAILELEPIVRAGMAHGRRRR
jgi:hypothetical protein